MIAIRTNRCEKMSVEQAICELAVDTPGAGMSDVTDAISDWLQQQSATDGLLTIFIRHTSASLTIQENADSDVQRDLVDALARLAPETERYRHDSEGPDDMPAHIKAALTSTSLSIPVMSGRMVLGTWQGVYIIEHRARPHRRNLVLHFQGGLGEK